MAVQGQYHARTIEPEFYASENRVEMKTNVKGDERPAIFAYNNMDVQREEAPQSSELTCNVSAPLTNHRVSENPSLPLNSFPDMHLLQAPANQFAGSSSFRPVNSMNHFGMMMGSSSMCQPEMSAMKRQRVMDYSYQCPPPVCGNVSMGARVPDNQMNNGFSTFPCAMPLVSSCSPSTSGRQGLTGYGSTGLEDEFSSISQNFESVTEDLISLEMERIKWAMEEERKRFYRAVMGKLVKAPVMQSLLQKRTELENAKRRNAELQQNLDQVNAENQAWINVAKNNEAIVAALRAQMEHVNNKYEMRKIKLEEGVGDSDEVESKAEDGIRVRHGDPFVCRVCGANDAIKLVLPCRHLSLCELCDMASCTCPVCGDVKLSTVPIRLK